MNVALKEWSAVIAALDCGVQIFVLRKGGIVEARRGFEPRYAEFLLFPTFEHQHARDLKPEWAKLLRASAKQPEDRVHISHLARVTDVLRAPQSPALLLTLADGHVWTDDFIRQRYDYRPDLPLYVMVIRAYRMGQPQLIPRRPSYAGCKSWVHLNDDVSTDVISPVLEDAGFTRRRRDLLRQLRSERLEDREQAAE